MLLSKRHCIYLFLPDYLHVLLTEGERRLNYLRITIQNLLLTQFDVIIKNMNHKEVVYYDRRWSACVWPIESQVEQFYDRCLYK